MTTRENTHRGYTINTGTHKAQACNINTLNQIIDRIEDMTDKHSKVLTVRIDIRNDTDNPYSIQRKDMTRILDNLKASLENKYKHSRHKFEFQYVWTAERTSLDNPEHFHLFILVNGNDMQNGYSIQKALNKQIVKRLQTTKEGLVHFSESNGDYGIMIRRDYENYQEQINKAVYVGSYLAKTYSKEYNAKGARFSSASRLPSKRKDDLDLSAPLAFDDGNDFGEY